MQTDRAAVARAVRRRLADQKLAEQLKQRGWKVEPPRDEVQKRVDAR